MSAIQKGKKRRPLQHICNRIRRVRGVKNKPISVLSAIDQTTILSQYESIQPLTPERPLKKRVSLLNQEESDISKKTKTKRKVRTSGDTKPVPAVSLLNNATVYHQEEEQEEEDNEMDKIRQELLSLRKQLAANGSPSASPVTRKKKPRRKEKVYGDENAANASIASPLSHNTQSRKKPTVRATVTASL